MSGHFEERASWTIQEAERLLQSLQGVVSVRIVARPGGVVEEIHLLTTTDVKPKQTVRNVESALLAHFDLAVDHRKISVAQTQEPTAELPEPELPIQIVPEPRAHEGRVLFYGHSMESERERLKLEAVATATIRAIEQAISKNMEEGRHQPSLSVDGVKVVDAFDRRFVLVAIHAISGRDHVRLAGTNIADESSDRAAILATLQATDRWVRGNFYS